MFSKKCISIACLGSITVFLALNTFAVQAQTTTPENAAAVPSQPVELKFSFGPRPIPGYTQVQADAAYSTERGYGFDLGSKVSIVDRGGDDPLKSGHATGQNGKPFFFSVKLTPGAYLVTVVLGDTAGESTTTVKSETRRLMLEAIHAAADQFQTRTFLVHLRSSANSRRRRGETETAQSAIRFCTCNGTRTREYRSPSWIGTKS